MMFLVAGDVAAIFQIHKNPTYGAKGDVRRFDNVAVRCVQEVRFAEKGKGDPECGCCSRASCTTEVDLRIFEFFACDVDVNTRLTQICITRKVQERQA